MPLLLFSIVLAATAAAQPPAEPPGPMRVGGDVKPPTKIFAPSPHYNDFAKKARVQGVVIVEANIDQYGNVTNAAVLRGLPMGLSQAALDAVNRWTFEPATLNGKPIAVLHTLTFRFRSESRLFKVIVNSGASTSSLSAKEIAQIFMKKTKAWPSGLGISPVNLGVDHQIREAFSEEIFGKKAEPIERRWDRLLFSGTAVPPLRVETEAEVVEFVRQNAAGVGYVGIDTTLPAGVTALQIE